MSISVKKKTIMDEDAMRRALVRISHEIVERNKGVEHVALCRHYDPRCTACQTRCKDH